MAESQTTNHDPPAGRRVIVGLSGGIACYKVAQVVSRLVQADIDVTVREVEERLWVDR